MVEITEWVVLNKLKLEFTNQYDDSVKENDVISTNYSKGDKIEQGTTIKVVISKGQLVMEDFKSFDEFREWADKYNIIYEEKHEFNEDVPQGQVISYSYKKGDTIKNGDSVIVTISDGKECKVPNVVGMTKSKAIDALDEAGSRVHISNIIVPKSIEELEAKIEATKNEKLAAVKSQNFELAASFRDKERQYLMELESAKAKWEKEMQEHRETVDEDKVAEVIAMMSGVPVQRIAKAENARLLEMSDILKSKVVGQDDAVHKIVKAIQRNRVGLKDPNKPIGTFMFLGPTGVGKTHLAKKLAEYLFDSADALIRIDMSEYLEKFAVSRLIGAPPGYVGYEEGGQLTEKVRRKPYSVVLLDEIEKAHPDVFNLLLQVLDEGRLTDSLGRRIDFKNTILIMTSNIGTRQLKDFGRGVGFNTQMAGEVDKDFSRGVIQKALNKAFAPEFLNRIDDIIMFDQLDKEAIYKIIDIELKGLYKRVKDLGYSLEITDAAKDFVASKGYDVQFGARPLKRAIQKYLEDEMAELIIRSSVTGGDTMVVDFDTNEQKIITSVKQTSGHNS